MPPFDHLEKPWATLSSYFEIFKWTTFCSLIMVGMVLLQYQLARKSTDSIISSKSKSVSPSVNESHDGDIACLSSSISHQREQKRRIQHALTGTILVMVSYWIPLNLAILLLSLGAGGIFYVKTYRVDWYQRTFGTLLRPTEQNHELPGAFYFLLGVIVTVLLVPMPIARYATLCLSWADPMAAWIGQQVSSSSSSSGGGGMEQRSSTRRKQGKLFKINTSSSGTTASGRLERIKLTLVRVFSWKLHSHATVAGCISCFMTAFFVGYIPSHLGWSSISTTFDKHDMAVPDQNDLLLLIRCCWGAMVCTMAEASPYGNDNLLIPIATAIAVWMFDQCFLSQRSL